MPLFTFECDACHSASEVLVRNGESPACPSCGSQKMAKGLSHFAAVSGGGDAMPSACDMGQACCGGGCGFSPN